MIFVGGETTGNQTGAHFFTPLFLFRFHPIVIYVLLFRMLVFCADSSIKESEWCFMRFMVIYDSERNGNMMIMMSA